MRLPCRPAVLALCLAACGCGGRPPASADGGGVGGTVPPRMVLGQGVGLKPVSAGKFSIDANLGQPLVRELSTPGGKRIQPGLMPQTQVK